MQEAECMLVVYRMIAGMRRKMKRIRHRKQRETDTVVPPPPLLLLGALLLPSQVAC